MAFSSVHDFIAMGGHGFYVWLSYGLVFGGLLVLILQTRSGQRRWLADQRRQLARQQARQQKSSSVSGDPS
ncbi:MAG: heme exporter protein CcmD [Perlucidibaca sp.]